MHGGGELIKWMRYARKGGDYSIVDGYFETTIKNSMYNGGKGKLESVAELVKRRNKERNERLSAFSRWNWFNMFKAFRKKQFNNGVAIREPPPRTGNTGGLSVEQHFLTEVLGLSEK